MRPEEQAAAVETLRRLHVALADGQIAGHATWWVYANGRAPEPVVACSISWLRRRAADCWLIEVRDAIPATAAA